MAIIVEWYDEADNIVIWRFESSWTWDEFYQAGVVSRKLFGANRARTDALMCYNASSQMPSGAFDHFAQIANTKMPENLGLIVILGENLGSKAIAKISAQVYGVDNWKVVNTMDEALALIAQDRANTANKADRKVIPKNLSEDQEETDNAHQSSASQNQ